MMNAYIPMFALAILAMMIFKLNFDLESRISNVSVILLAYIAFIPVLRNIIPPVSYLTLSDMILLSNITGTIAIMLESYFVADYANNI